MTSPTFISSPHTHLESSATHYAHPGKVRRIKCPVHGGTDRNVSLGNGWAKCHSRGCASADILAALGETPANHWTPPPPRPRPAISIAPLPPVSPIAASLYLDGIKTGAGAEIAYQRNDGLSGRHWRNTNKRRNPGVRGDGWQVRRFNPADPGNALAISLCEGEKDAAVLALAGLVAFAAPRGAQSLPSADLTELVELAKSTALPVLLCGDKDDAGHQAMLRIRENLLRQGVKSTDTMTYAPPKGSIADLAPRDLAALIERLIADRNPRWQKPARNHRKYAEYRCPHPRHWQALASDYAVGHNLRPCEKAATCPTCAAWELYLHIERADRGNPAQLVDISGFGNPDSRIPETTGFAKDYREHLIDRLRKNSGIRPLDQNVTTGEKRNFLTALRIRDDYRAGLALILDTPLTSNQLDRERKRAEKAGLTFTVIDLPGRAAIEAIAPQALTISMEGQGRTATTRTWTSSDWPTWNEHPPAYAFSDGRYLPEGEAFAPGSVSVKEWRRDNRQSWDGTLTYRANLERRELDAHQNAQRWVSACLGLNLEILDGIANATSSKEIAALVREVGDYDGPTALLRDTAAYLKTGRGWRAAYGPVLDSAGMGA